MFGKIARNSENLNFRQIFWKEAAVAGIWQGIRDSQGCFEGHAPQGLKWTSSIIKGLEFQCYLLVWQ